MKKTMIVGAVALLASVLGTSAARAQDAPVQKPISIKVGGYFPQDGDARKIGDTWLHVGGDYAFGKTDTESPLLKLGYLDYVGKEKDGVRGQYIGLGIGVRAYANRATNSTVSPFYGAGVGVYFEQAKGGGETKNKTGLGLKASAGVELNQGAFVEVGYTYLPEKIEGTDLSGFTADLGYRF
ncbi:MAG: outer membrane beta-barrel protein [Capsulimonas sp.]|uniref:outer membrane beta-barrel protein n=1 Tax=Capsulimonas sp. TaxID=2494211 RepID=UPI003264300C